MGLEESPHCPFDVVEACRTGDLDTGSGDRGTRFADVSTYSADELFAGLEVVLMDGREPTFPESSEQAWRLVRASSTT